MTAFTNSIVDVPGIRVGNAQNEIALTGCTVILCNPPGVCGVDVRGSAPGTRETDLLAPTNLVESVNAICLCGGSAYGLDAASGVMQYLEERGIGLDVGVGIVPIVPAAVIFDLAIGNGKIRPDAAMGYQAAAGSSAEAVVEGNVGAGCGATVGKLFGLANAMKGGLGSASANLPNGLIVGAIVAVNAIGEIRDPDSGTVLAGPRGEDDQLLDSLRCLAAQSFAPMPPGTNTTIAVVATNATLNKTQMNKVAQMAHDGIARAVYPAHTMHDGDTVFAISMGGASVGGGSMGGTSVGAASAGGVEASVDVVGSLAASVLAEAIARGIKAATSAGGLPAYRDLIPRIGQL